MEHRWGERVGVDIPVRIRGHQFSACIGRLANLSVSGAFIRAAFKPRLRSRIHVQIALPQRPMREAPVIAAYVSRKFKHGIGIEWCNFKPPAVNRLLQWSAARRYKRGTHGRTAGGGSRVSAPLLKHGN